VKTHVRREGAVHYARCGRRVPPANLVEAQPTCRLCRLLTDGYEGPPKAVHAPAGDSPRALCGRALTPKPGAVTCKDCLGRLQPAPPKPLPRLHLLGVGGKTLCGRAFPKLQQPGPAAPWCFHCNKVLRNEAG
jgi:hypothetical protein